MTAQTLATVEMRGVCKSYPGVRALRGVDLTLNGGEVHCLVGENGAGKSTLMRILSGAERPDEGEILIDGGPIAEFSPKTAHLHGVSMIYQEVDLVPELSIAQNMFLGHEPVQQGVFLSERAMNAQAEEVLGSLGVVLPVTAAVSSLSSANGRFVQIAKALTRNARVLIMDEPSAVLSDHELEGLFEVVDRLRTRGIAIVYISHRLEEVFRLADRVTVLRDGEVVASMPAEQATQEAVIQKMVGREIKDQYVRTGSPQNEVALRTVELSANGRFESINIEVRKGEILGVAGLVGAGRSSLLGAIAGDVKTDRGHVEVLGKRSKHRLRSRIRDGVALVPEDRRGAGLAVGRSVGENLALANLDVLAVGPLMRRRRANKLAADLIQRLGIKTPSARQPVKFLSGGNQQKVVLGKWLSRGVTVLLLDEPTVGVDVGAKREIYTLMDELTRAGMAIIMASSELPEVLGMSDRIIVLSEGRLTAQLNRNDATQENIMEAAVPRSTRVSVPVAEGGDPR
ncbi:MAG: sugar ABC transporter ATP-binding protein [Propionicimonas sp.]